MCCANKINMRQWMDGWILHIWTGANNTSLLTFALNHHNHNHNNNSAPEQPSLCTYNIQYANQHAILCLLETLLFSFSLWLEQSFCGNGDENDQTLPHFFCNSEKKRATIILRTNIPLFALFSFCLGDSSLFVFVVGGRKNRHSTKGIHQV